MSEKNFFIESAFGEVYEGSFFADDFPKTPKETPVKTVEDAKFNEATSKVRMNTEVEINHQVTEKINSMYGLGNLGSSGGMFSNFNGNIFGGF
ncbi:MAG: hypothetical protein IKZ58_01045 [Selenomonadaceae bacterium]|nr:hypothetical protein [Selenomonadaceae bacterium]